MRTANSPRRIGRSGRALLVAVLAAGGGCGRGGQTISSAPLAASIRSVVDSTGDVGYFDGLTFDGNDNAHVSYYDASARKLKYARQRGGASWDLIAVDDLSADYGRYTAIAVDEANNPRIAYYDAQNRVLKLALYNGFRFIVVPVDQSANVGANSQLLIDLNSTNHIAYVDLSSMNLRYVTYAIGVTQPTPIVIDEGIGPQSTPQGGNLNLSVSMAFSRLQEPWFAYYDASNGNLKAAHYAPSSGQSQVWTVEWQKVAGERLTSFTQVSGGSPGWMANLVHPSSANYGETTIYQDGVPIPSDTSHFIFIGVQTLEILAADYNQGSLYTVDYVRTDTSPEDDGRFCSIALDALDRPHVSYYDADNFQLKYAYSPADGVWQTEVLDGPQKTQAMVGGGTSIALGPDGEPIIVYTDLTNGNLRLAIRSSTGTGGAERWNLYVIDPSPQTGFDPKISLSPKGEIGVSYYQSVLRPGEDHPEGILWFAKVQPPG